MVSPDNLHLDVLELIFSFLNVNGDLAAVALVSRSFLTGVLPKLYCTLPFRLRHSKRYPDLTSPFAVVLAHKDRAIFVRHVDIRDIPKYQNQLHPSFLRECNNALKLCHNLISFKCTVNALPSFLHSLQNKTRMKDLRVNGNLTMDQSDKLCQVSNLRSIALDYGSWNTMDMLPRWIQSHQNTLSHLIIYMSTELNETVLQSVVVRLPSLLGLHCIGCPKVDHAALLRVVAHTPQLESLSMSTAETSKDLEIVPPSLKRLKHLAFLTRYSVMPLPSPSPMILSAILQHLQPSASPIVSFTLRLPDKSIVVGHPFIEQLLQSHSQTLKNICFIDTTISLESVVAICSSCIHLERLELPLPLKEFISFSHAVGRSYTLSTIIDTSQQTHGPHMSLHQDNVRYIMISCRSLKKIISGNRVWTGQRGLNNSVIPMLENRPASQPSNYWFMPRE
ncbi:hypothetical protein C8J56DRAFT_926553 [Mycena floridula]|nr:hypothetical protein C8J56DRAFT_926553 [Mycena floridula]